MRDLLIVGFLLYACFFALRRPYLGVAGWIWIALAAPTEWVFGFSQNFRPNLTIVLVTAVAFLFSRGGPGVRFNGLFGLVLFFCGWTLLSTIGHESFDGLWVWDAWVRFVKIVLLFIFVVLTVRTRLQVDTVVWAIVLAVSSYAAMEGVKFLLSGGGHRIQGMAGIIEDRNHLAVAINMCLPLVVYLIGVTHHRALRFGLWLLVVLNIVAVVGTYSRGGFIGLAILGFAVWLASRHKLVIALAAMLLLPVAYQFAPEDWKSRQSTIASAAAEDSSFIGRLWAWKISVMIANENPIIGGGFGAVTDPVLWARHAPATPSFGPIETPPIPQGLSPKAAHNIFLQVLGDHGWVGLFLFLSVLGLCFFVNLRNVRAARAAEVVWFRQLASAINLALVGYGITGANVSLAYFDLLYTLIGLVVVMTVWRQELLGTGKPQETTRSVQDPNWMNPVLAGGRQARWHGSSVGETLRRTREVPDA
ncbi:putative O-glycosylation ligase, exosortase A system-associated [Pseudohaliea sp.]|uniref:putative O-glycosylation ligase, exosortase A system-associated n=1 Tax=Pseudohaliea sp. TaxID=2740289 RepID=UPI0032ECC09F